MIEIVDKKDCCGCSACATICPKQCILMQEDFEGFLYPIVDIEKCVDCLLCEKVCPIIHVKSEVEKRQSAFIVQHKNSTVLKESTSGGAFTAIAKWILDRGGVVFGAGFDKNFNVTHQKVDKYSDLKRFRNSKYVQSKIGDSYQLAKKELNEGKWVCFSGTPCQIEGLLSYLQTAHERLVTVDVVCRACPSPMVLRKYLNMQKNKFDITLQDVKFRDKFHGYKYSVLSLYDKNSNSYHQGIDIDYYLRSFFAGFNVRPSCLKCVFRKQYRNADFTLWDCFDVAKFCKFMDDDRGATRILTHSELAEKILLESATELKIVSIDVAHAVKDVKEMRYSITENINRTAFFEDLNRMDVEVCFNKYLPITLRHRLERQVRLFFIIFGFYKQAKAIFKLVQGKREMRR